MGKLARATWALTEIRKHCGSLRSDAENHIFDLVEYGLGYRVDKPSESDAKKRRRLVIKIDIDECPPEIKADDELDYLAGLIYLEPDMLLDEADFEIVEVRDDRDK